MSTDTNIMHLKTVKKIILKALVGIYLKPEKDFRLLKTSLGGNSFSKFSFSI
jgi:hypothetical protein